MRSFRLPTTPRAAALALIAAAACAPAAPPLRHASSGSRADAPTAVAVDTVVPSDFAAAGTAEPVLRATLSTKLMGTVTAVLVHEGDRVGAGQPLLRIDARDLDARATQAGAGVAAAEAAYHEAELQAVRIRGLYADSAAPRVQLDAAESGLAQARAALDAAHAGAAEVATLTRYAAIQAPFAGVITQRSVDPGAFAAPGAPLLTLEDASRLRVTVTAPPEIARRYRRGSAVVADIEGIAAPAVVEAVVPGPVGNLYQVNAIVDNRAGRFASGGAASLALSEGTRRAVLVPAAAVVREGDLTGVRVRGADGVELRWVRLGAVRGDLVEVLGGLAGGERVLTGTAGTEG